MALSAVIASTEGLPEDVSKEYRDPTEAEVAATPALKDMKVLDVTPTNGMGLDNVDALRTTLSKEKGRADRAEQSAAAFGDLKADDVKARLEKLTELESLDPEKEADAIAQRKVDAAKAQMSEAHAAEVDQLKKVGSGYRSQLEDVLITDAARAAIVEAGGSSEALLPHIQSSIKLVEKDGRFEKQVVDAEGNPRIGDSQGGPMTVSQLVEEFKGKEAFAPLFVASGNSGGGAGGGSGGGSPPKGAAQKKSEMDLNQRAAYIEEHGQESYLSLPA